jgi:hypothetical protein
MIPCDQERRLIAWFRGLDPYERAAVGLWLNGENWLILALWDTSPRLHAYEFGAP